MRGNWTAVILAALLCQAASAQTRQTVNVSQGLQTIIQFPEPFSTATVGDPDIIDTMPTSDRSLIVVGKRAGTSDVMLLRDGRLVHHIRVAVAGPTVPGKVMAHSQKNLHDFTAYSCTPVCARVEDKFEARQVIILGPGGPISATSQGSTINILTPPSR